MDIPFLEALKNINYFDAKMVSATYNLGELDRTFFTERSSEVIDYMEFSGLTDEQKQKVIANPENYGLLRIETSVFNDSSKYIRVVDIDFGNIGYLATNNYANPKERIIEPKSNKFLYDDILVDLSTVQSQSDKIKSNIYFDCGDNYIFEDVNDLYVIENQSFLNPDFVETIKNHLTKVF